jgi:toxin FitB
MIVLDTNIISELGRYPSSLAVRDWYSAQKLDDLYLCTPVISEIAFGADRVFLRDNSRRYQNQLKSLLYETYVGRILPFDLDAALENGKLRSVREAAGKPIGLGDAQIAAICLVHGATLATRNVRDFDGLGLKLVNPFEA